MSKSQLPMKCIIFLQFKNNIKIIYSKFNSLSEHDQYIQVDDQLTVPVYIVI
jgi:hypothetical protein